MSIFPVILSGGIGSRLWPLSRESTPKQFLSLLGGKTMIQATALRMDAITDAAPLTVVCNEAHRFLVEEQLNEIGAKINSLILEPVARNTAPALALAALQLLELDPNAIFIALPADHIVTNENALGRAVELARLAAKDGYIATFGVRPVSPETGYGYIRLGGRFHSDVPSIHFVAEFVEKPGVAVAEEYVRGGGYLWNSGIFVARADRYLEELKKFRPDIYQASYKAMQEKRADGLFIRPSVSEFSACSAESIDYGVMQATEQAVVVPVDFGWSDVGSWSSLWSITEKDQNGNAVSGDVIVDDSYNTYVRAESRLVAAIGVTDLVVVETADAVLIMNKEKAEDIKRTVSTLEKIGRKECMQHLKIYRPWGWYEGIDSDQRFQVKRIMVKPGGKLSLQLHHHRAEHWIVVSGTALVTVDGNETMLTENQSTYIPLGRVHRLENPGKIPLHLIEVQSGAYLGEDDIVRFADNYGRVGQ
jgi:mannose-1-phosphate guanylyltransferase/mannose-1-phosphate guanylyltransferase/mannose-6-phosphate isomerase